MKGSSDPQTLSVLFFHFFYKLGIADEFSEFPSDMTFDKINECTSPFPFILYKADREAGFAKLSEAQTKHKNVESFSISNLEQTGDLAFGKKRTFVGSAMMLILEL